ncbi:MAG: hypothetical protein IPP19_00225 [Verrucomicrobia bacterium]|nr:hypothetical protein [Verrucomicrobiota bacterium]
MLKENPMKTKALVISSIVILFAGCVWAQNSGSSDGMSGTGGGVVNEKSSHYKVLCELSSKKGLDLGDKIGVLKVSGISDDLLKVELSLYQHGQMKASKWYSVGESINLDPAFGTSGLVVAKITKAIITIEQNIAN